jgi:hypothetical protein
VLDFIDDLFCCVGGCRSNCCEPPGCCEVSCDGYGESAPAKAAPAEEAAPLPKAPKADPSASFNRDRGVRVVSRTIAR